MLTSVCDLERELVGEGASIFVYKEVMGSLCPEDVDVLKQLFVTLTGISSSSLLAPDIKSFKSQLSFIHTRFDIPARFCWPRNLVTT